MDNKNMEKNSRQSETVETVTDTKQDYFDYNYLYSSVRQWIDIFTSDPQNNINELKNEPQNVFNACMRYVGRNYIRPILDANKIKGALNVDLIDMLLNIYIDITSIYNKELNTIGFSYFTNTSIDTYNDWLYKDSPSHKVGHEITQKRVEIAKKIKRLREDSLSNMLTSGKNPVGTMAILNHQYHWNSDDEIYAERQKALTLAQLPTLAIGQNDTN